MPSALHLDDQDFRPLNGHHDHHAVGHSASQELLEPPCFCLLLPVWTYRLRCALQANYDESLSRYTAVRANITQLQDIKRERQTRFKTLRLVLAYKIGKAFETRLGAKSFKGLVRWEHYEDMKVSRLLQLQLV